MNYLIYSAFAVVGLCFDIRIIYLLFLFLVFQKFFQIRKINTEFFFALALYSIILPDNYVVEFFFLFYYAMTIVLNRRMKVKRSKYNLCVLLLTIISVLSTSVNAVPTVNILFAIVSFSPMLVFLCLLNDTEILEEIAVEKYLDDILVIEMIATVINFVLYRKTAGDDWSCGTFSRSGGQQAQLFIIVAFLMIFYCGRYQKKKEQGYLLKIIVCGILLISTNCWTLLVMFLIGIIISYICTPNRKKVMILLTIIVVCPFFATAAYSMLPGRITVPLYRMLNDAKYLDYRFHKLTVYYETFVEIPSEDIQFALIGNGLGHYNSRGALICTGKYTGFYDNFFEPSVSEYTEEYILDYVSKAYENGSSDFGSVLARPYSSFLALMGECGYVGCIVFILLLGIMLKNKKSYARSLIIVWLSFCFIENYFEYSKVLLLLYVCIVSSEQINKSKLLTESG